MRLTKDSLVRWLAVLLLAFPATVMTAACEAEGEVGTENGGGGGDGEGGESEGEGGESEGGEGEGGDTELEGEVETD
jgi:hypothetical protein